MTSSVRRRLLAERMTRQGLASRPAGDPAAATALTTAIQAQDAAASRLGLRARAGGLTDARVRGAIDDEHSIVRTWLMRGTIHLVDRADIRWLVRLIGPAVQRKYRTRWAQLGLTPPVLERCTQLLPELLAAGPLDRHAIQTALRERGITLDSADPQLPAHVLVHASTIGLVCRATDGGRAGEFVLLDDWLPGAPAGPAGDDALAELARRYFAAYSPATAADFTTWCALPAARAIELIRDELSPAEVDGRPGYRLGEVAPARALRLLPAFDNYVLGYRDRAALLDPARHGQVYQGGMIRPTVVRDGAIIGTWSLDRGRGRLRVAPFEPLAAAALRQLRGEAADVGRFLARDLELTVDDAP